MCSALAASLTRKLARITKSCFIVWVVVVWAEVHAYSSKQVEPSSTFCALFAGCCTFKAAWVTLATDLVEGVKVWRTRVKACSFIVKREEWCLGCCAFAAHWWLLKWAWVARVIAAWGDLQARANTVNQVKLACQSSYREWASRIWWLAIDQTLNFDL